MADEFVYEIYLSIKKKKPKYWIAEFKTKKEIITEFLNEWGDFKTTLFGNILIFEKDKKILDDLSEQFGVNIGVNHLVKPDNNFHNFYYMRVLSEI